MSVFGGVRFLQFRFSTFPRPSLLQVRRIELFCQGRGGCNDQVLYYSKTLIIEIERPRLSNVPRFTVHFEWSKVSNLTYSLMSRFILIARKYPTWHTLRVTVHSDWSKVSNLTYSLMSRFILIGWMYPYWPTLPERGILGLERDMRIIGRSEI